MSEEEVAAITRGWPEELQGAFWSAVNAPTYDESSQRTLSLVHLYARHMAARQREAVGRISRREPVCAWRLVDKLIDLIEPETP